MYHLSSSITYQTQQWLLRCKSIVGKYKENRRLLSVSFPSSLVSFPFFFSPPLFFSFLSSSTKAIVSNFIQSRSPVRLLACLFGHRCKNNRIDSRETRAAYLVTQPRLGKLINSGCTLYDFHSAEIHLADDTRRELIPQRISNVARQYRSHRATDFASERKDCRPRVPTVRCRRFTFIHYCVRKIGNFSELPRIRAPSADRATRVTGGLREFKIALPTRHSWPHGGTYIHRACRRIFMRFAYNCINHGTVTFLLQRMHKASRHVLVFTFIDLATHMLLPGVTPASVIRALHSTLVYR